MNTPDPFFQPEKIDEQIEQLRQEPLAASADAELIAYLHSSLGRDAAQEQAALNRMRKRIADSTSSIQQYPRKGTITSMPEQQTVRSNIPVPKQHSPRGRRLGILAAILFAALLVGGMAAVFNMIHNAHNGSAGPGPNPTGTAPVATQRPTAAAFQVTGVTMSVSPASIANMSCGSQATVQYTALFHVAANSPGGTIQFQYTVNNGRSSQPASLTFAPGQTTRTFSFTWSGSLPADHTYPSLGGVQVTSPNQLTSQLVGPNGSCTQQASAFKVLSVGMSVTPSSLTGLHCGSSLLVTYTATFHVAANSPGGTIQFQYTVNNGRGSQPASLTFAPGQTTRTFSFTWSGSLPADHTYPGQGGVQVTSPNTITSPLVGPSGRCS